MALCVPKVMILGHSFVRRLGGDLEQHFDDRAKSNFDRPQRCSDVLLHLEYKLHLCEPLCLWAKSWI